MLNPKSKLSKFFRNGSNGFWCMLSSMMITRICLLLHIISSAETILIWDLIICGIATVWITYLQLTKK